MKDYIFHALFLSVLAGIFTFLILSFTSSPKTSVSNGNGAGNLEAPVATSMAQQR